MFVTLSFLLFSIVRGAVCGEVAMAPGNASYLTDATGSKDTLANLVKALKQNLRKNNDDYFNKTGSSTYFTKQTETSTKSIFEDYPINIYNKSDNLPIYKDVQQRRAVNIGDSRVFPIVPDRPTRGDPSRPPRENPARPNKLQKPTTQESPRLSPAGHQKDGSVDKAERLKQFMMKNQDLLKDFVSSKLAEARTEAARGGDEGGLSEEGEGEGVLRERGGRGREPVPSALQLDMAPARGGRILALRNKGRLCQRNVLMPEGPKYDSSGHIYLRAFTGPGEYSRTRPPALVLPRCCNCCKKSVLGCE